MVDIKVAVSQVHAITRRGVLRSDNLIVDEETPVGGIVQVHIIEIVVHVLSREIVQIVTVALHHVHIGVV